MKLINADAIFFSETIIYGKKLVEKSTIDRMTAIDAEPVVRCKECNNLIGGTSSVARHCCLSGIPVDDDDFCSYGERRDAND